jgi:hypothetical protein
MSHTASGTSFTSLTDLCDGLESLDELKGLPYGGAAPLQKTMLSKIASKKSSTVGFVAAVQDTPYLPSNNLETHKESWVGAINLLEDHVKKLHQMFKCVQCCTNDHTLPSCPFMKNWIIKKKLHQDTTQD